MLPTKELAAFRTTTEQRASRKTGAPEKQGKISEPCPFFLNLPLLLFLSNLLKMEYRIGSGKPQKRKFAG